MMSSTTSFVSSLLLVALFVVSVQAFGVPSLSSKSTTGSLFGVVSTTTKSTSPLFASTSKPLVPKKKGYEPKWKKKKTLAEEIGAGISDGKFELVGIKGDIPVVFKQGNDTKQIMASVGQPLRDVATQAGQFIKYGCGKGECGVCEALVDGKWIRPCCATIPASCQPGVEYVVSVKEVKSKAASSGKFYTFRSFIMGFWNNLLGMLGFWKSRRAAKKNWDERKEQEELIKQRTLEKKRQRMLEQQQNSGGGLGLQP